MTCNIANDILKKSEEFHKKVFVLQSFNSTKNIMGNDCEKICHIFSSIKVVCCNEIINYFDYYVNKIKNGKSGLANVYKDTIKNPYDLMNRFLTKRPLVFMEDYDMIRVFDNNQVNDLGNNIFYPYSLSVLNNDVKQMNKYFPLVPKEYMIYDELKLSALLVVSCETEFINFCGRKNDRKLEQNNSYVKNGIILGAVGPRFEKEGVMEYDDMIMKNDEINKKVSRYNLYTKRHKIISGMNGKLFNNKLLFDIGAYEKRIKLLAKLSLLESNIRARKKNKKAYVIVQGLGLGVWHPANKLGEIFKNDFNYLYFLYWKEVVQEYINILENIETVFFPYNNNEQEHEIIFVNSKYKNKKIPVIRDNGVGDILSKREILNIIKRYNNKFTEEQIDNELLCCFVFAWDSNSFPGNEYWLGSFSASADPAAGSCSQITEILNKHINPFYKTIGKYRNTIRNVDKYISKRILQNYRKI